MIEPKAMSHEIEVSDPLSWAIGEFREELLLWIDTELVRLRERDQAGDGMMEEEPAAAIGSRASALWRCSCYKTRAYSPRRPTGNRRSGEAIRSCGSQPAQLGQPRACGQGRALLRRSAGLRPISPQVLYRHGMAPLNFINFHAIVFRYNIAARDAE